MGSGTSKTIGTDWCSDEMVKAINNSKIWRSWMEDRMTNIEDIKKLKLWNVNSIYTHLIC